MNADATRYDEGGIVAAGAMPLNPSTDGQRLELYPYQERLVHLAMAAILERAREIDDAWESVKRAVEGTTFALSDAERARRVDTLRREAAAALGRGDRKEHRKKLAELRRLDRRLP